MLALTLVLGLMQALVLTQGFMITHSFGLGQVLVDTQVLLRAPVLMLMLELKLLQGVLRHRAVEPGADLLHMAVDLLSLPPGIGLLPIPLL